MSNSESLDGRGVWRGRWSSTPLRFRFDDWRPDRLHQSPELPAAILGIDRAQQERGERSITSAKLPLAFQQKLKRLQSGEFSRGAVIEIEPDCARRF
jgi:hypothetical protein